MNAYELADELEKSMKICEDHGTIARRSSKVVPILRQQADRIAKYEQVLQAIANDYHELSDHKIEVQVRNHKKWAREALE